MKENRIVKIGRVLSDKMDKTRVVRVETLKQHPLYKKTIKHRVKFKAHDETNSCHAGDTVKIIQTRPLSKTKRWQVVEIVRHEAMPDKLITEISELEIREKVEENDTASDQTESSG